MRKLILFAFLAATFSVNAQIGATAPDFTVTDMDGNTHNLYEILDQGIIAVVDVSATWCSPCWTLHESHALTDLHEQHGPGGSNSVRVLFYEGDAQTDDAAMGGTGNTQGDWLTGTPYPMINESPLTLDLNIWAPLGFPTVNVIRPSDRQIVADTWDILTVEGQIDAIEASTGIALGVEDVVEAASFNIFPVPASKVLNVDLSGVSAAINQIVITDTFGRIVKTQSVNTAAIETIQVADLAAGVYTIQLQENSAIVATKQFIK